MFDGSLANVWRAYAVNCEWNDWDTASACSATCGPGTQSRIKKTVENDEGTCSGDATRPCNDGACPGTSL